MRYLFFLISLFTLTGCHQQSPEDIRIVIPLTHDWKFVKSDIPEAQNPLVDDGNWEMVNVPHDWAIGGPFDMSIDMQNVRVVADGEFSARKRFGRTGALPHTGVAWYRKTIELPELWRDKLISIEFDGAMSNAEVFFNGFFVGTWPYGYSSFQFDLTKYCRFGDKNVLAVRLENKPRSSRWYPGAGIYRNVRLVVKNPLNIKHWGTKISTPDIASGNGTVNIETIINRVDLTNTAPELITRVFDAKNRLVSEHTTIIRSITDTIISQQLLVETPELWSVDNPVIYRVESQIKVKNKIVDNYESKFGFRFFEFTADSGFILNGVKMKLNGVCLHHDLGPLGSAVNKYAIRRQLHLLKDMGCNAIRTSHNPPAPELLDLCDEMGFLVIDEAFDEWKISKAGNGYSTLWDEWAEKDLVALIKRDRNHPSVIMWSIGNEILEQKIENGDDYCRFLTDICHREDPTRPVTAGFNHWEDAVKNGFADIVDVVGWNYKPEKYNELHRRFPHWKMYGSETASTVSSRGEYFFPAEPCVNCVRESRHCSSYDMEYPPWANSPDTEFAAQDSFPFIAGEFVWTGFDYLGEPTPYNETASSRSSYFGIFDLCGFPKDRFYLYQSQWTDKDVLHLLPHWNWEGKEDEIIPVFCYTNFSKAELFLNGKSMGIREKNPTELYSKYRLRWDVPYSPGELKVIALDKENNFIKETIQRTASQPSKIMLNSYSSEKTFAKDDLIFITAFVVDDEGVFCPTASDSLRFIVEGDAEILATGNGDPTSLVSFSSPARRLFNGKCLVVMKPKSTNGSIRLTATSGNMEPASIDVP